jgi:hypothetical protein
VKVAARTEDIFIRGSNQGVHSFISNELGNVHEVGLLQVLQAGEGLLEVLSKVEDSLGHLDDLFFLCLADAD